jgi:putative phage-type endonuclease
VKTQSLIANTPEWHAHRAQHFNASDAPAMMGCSPYQTRSQLLHKLHTGLSADVDAATQRAFDAGHRFESLARPLAEEIIGDDLAPVVGTEGELSASFDGLTLMADVAWEHKTVNDDLRKAFAQIETIAPKYRDKLAADELPMHYRVQMEQQLAVSKAEKCLFMASKWDGDTLVEEHHCWYYPDMELRANIVAGWRNFAQDLANYTAPEVVVPAVAAPQMGLPAVSIQVNGSIALVDNLDKFGAALTAYVARINKKPETDQDFADLEATAKTLKAAEDALDAAETGALAQTESIDSMRKTVALYRETARTNRLLVEKLVKAEKENRRIAIVSEAAAELIAHMRKLNERLGRPYMPVITADFQGVIKGLKSLDSMKDKVATELARCKIEANATADRIQANLETKGLHGYSFLFADMATLCLKAPDDFQAAVSSRIAGHEAAELAKEVATRERIRAEEQAKAERDAREKLAREQAEHAHAVRVEAERIQREQIVQAQAARIREEQTVAVNAEVPKDSMIVATGPRVIIPLKTGTPPTMTLGEISTRLSFNVTSAFLATLGFEATTVRAAKMYHADDFKAICEAIKTHIGEVQDAFEAATA